MGVAVEWCSAWRIPRRSLRELGNPAFRAVRVLGIWHLGLCWLRAWEGGCDLLLSITVVGGYSGAGTIHSRIPSRITLAAHEACFPGGA